MAEDWREFEKLVARIERAVGPLGGVVTSPDYLTDSVTGELREVDLCIRPRKHSPPVRVVECRDRARVEDVTWIEQLVTKTLGHGVPTTAVSSKGFSTAAAEKAAHYGIEIRLVSEITQDEMTGWVKINEVVHVVLFPVIDGVSIVLCGEPGESGEPLLHPSVAKQLDAGAGKALVFVRNADGKRFSACQILDAALRKERDLFRGLPQDGTKVRKRVAIRFGGGLFQVQTGSGFRDLSRLILDVDLHVKKSSSSFPDKGFSYRGTGRPLVYGIEAEADVLGNAILVSFHKQAGCDLLNMTITKRKEGK